MAEDIRWKQRFQNFEKAFLFLQSSLQESELSDLEKAGVTQAYEFTFELAWKTLKDYLEENEVSVKFPRDTIKAAFQYDLIEDGDLWMDMLQKRNLMAHTYNETNAELAFTLIKSKYFQALKQIYVQLQDEL